MLERTVRMVIVGFGDSLTFGFPYSPRYSWLHIVGKRTGAKTINKGVCGETTADMLVRFRPAAWAEKPDFVIIMGGSNDAFAGIVPEEVAANLQLMAERAIANQVTPLLGLPVPCDFPEEELLEEYRRWMRQYAAKTGIGLIDFYQVLRQENGGIKTGYHVDGVHPNEAGYRLMADAAVGTLLQVYKIQESKQNRLVD